MLADLSAMSFQASFRRDSSEMLDGKLRIEQT
jgi:hypothetical protein